MEPPKDITLIIPTLNEVENLPLLLKEIKKISPDIKIIISDDGSIDGTREIVKKFSKKNKNIKLIDRAKKNPHGLCASVVDAILHTRTKYFIVMDGDLQHPPEKIKDFLKEFERDYGLVIGARKEVKNWKLRRKLISKIANFMGEISLLLRQKRTPRDILSGFFGGETEIMKEVIKKNLTKFELKGYKILFDLLKILPEKIKVKEVSYNFGERNRGKSKINQRHIISFIKSLIA